MPSLIRCSALLLSSVAIAALAAPLAFAATQSGIDTPNGVKTLPLAVEGTAIITLTDNPTSTATIDGAAKINGATTINGAETVSGASTVGGNSNVGGNATVSGNATVGGSLTVSNLSSCGTGSPITVGAGGVLSCACTPTSKNQTVSCPAGDTGLITQEMDYTCTGGVGAWGNWYTTSNTCASTPPSCTPTSQYQTQSCPAGYTGIINQEQDYTCTGSVGAWGSWYTTSNTCAVAAPVCGAGQSYVASVSMCVPNQQIVSNSVYVCSATASVALNTIVGYYQTVLGRCADAAGLQYWYQQYQSGQSLATIKSNFQNVAATPASKDNPTYNSSLTFLKAVCANNLSITYGLTWYLQSPTSDVCLHQ